MLPPARAAKLLAWVLIFNGALTLCAFPAIFLPTAWMDAAHRHLGLGPMPEGPIVEYLARSISGLYAAFGSMTLVVAYDVRRFGPLVTWWGATAVVFGGILFGVDQAAKMPPSWTWGEGPYLIFAGATVLLLERAMRRADRPPR